MPVATVKQQEQQQQVILGRKDVADLSDAEIDAFRDAVAALKSLTDNRSYNYLAGIPGVPLPMYAQLNTPAFLPWNRALLWTFERSLGQPLPYWDWTEVRSIPSMFQEPPLDSSPLPEGLPDEYAGRTATTREPNASETFLPTRQNVADVLAIEDYVAFGTALENLNGVVHVWVGGDMGAVPTS